MQKHIPTFTLPNGDPIIRDRQMQYAYLQYREKYRDAVGVYPEFDLIHKPVCGVLYSLVIYPDDLDQAMKDNTKKGVTQMFTSALRGGLEAVDYGKKPWEKTVSLFNDFIPDNQGNYASIAFGSGYKLYPMFKKTLKTAMEKYKFFYSALVAVDFDEIEKMATGTYLNDDATYEYALGKRKLENGVYVEGTWKDGAFIYGLAYIPELGLFAGHFRNEQMTDGVWLDEDGVFSFGTFNAEGELECENAIKIYTKKENPSSKVIFFMEIGHYVHAREHGFFLQFLMEEGNVIYMSDTKYDFGEEVQMSAAERSARKKLYTTSKFERIVSYYWSVMFMIVAVVLFAYSAGNILAILVGVAFGIAGILRFRSALKQSKRAKELNS